jgi:uncharacterized damage-inducible protein DinB
MENLKSNEFYKQWQIVSRWISETLNSLTDEDLKKTISPGRNHGVWILGHLIQSEDELSKYLGKGEYIFPENERLFGQKNKPGPVSTYPDVPELRKQWETVKAKNDKIISEITDAEWDEPHALIEGSIEDDYFKTKGGCIMNWIVHQTYHIGQLVLLRQKP